MLYRLLTENKNLPQVEKLISDQFEGFTLYKAQGYWRLQKENTLVIEIETSDMDKINKLAKQIKEANKQEAVLVQEIKNKAYLV